MVSAVLIALLALASPLRAQVAYVNSATAADPSGGSKTSLSTPSFTTGAGNLIVVGVRQGTDTTPPGSVTDSAGNTYTHFTGADSSLSSTNLLSIWYATGITASAANAVTATWPAGHTLTSLIARQYSGVSSADAAGASTGSGKTLSAGITVGLNSGGVTVAFGSGSNANSTFSAGTIGGSAATNFIADAASGAELAASEDRLSSQSTAISANMKQSTGSSWEFSVASFAAGSGSAPPGSGGGTPPPSGGGVVAAGTLTVSNSTSATHTFPTALPAGSICGASPAFDPASLPSLTWWVTNTTTSVTVRLDVAGSGTWTFICTTPAN